jgi:peptidoglycan hydrolase-like protein with peptidoglycan-binding domain
VDGRWPTAHTLAARFPHAHLLTIAVDPAHDADCLDIETSDATPASAAAWFERQKARGVQRPCLYASVTTMQTGVMPVLKAAGIDRSQVRLWTAHYAGLHVCAHDTCGELGLPADGTQWTAGAFGRDLDQSLLTADFFAVPAPQPAPAPSPVPAWQEALMNKLPTLSEGAADQPGHVFFVHRAKALARVYGEITGLAEAAALPVDGTYDAATKAAVQQIQEHMKITADGITGPQTWAVLATGAV